MSPPPPGRKETSTLGCPPFAGIWGVQPVGLVRIEPFAAQAQAYVFMSRVGVAVSFLFEDPCQIHARVQRLATSRKKGAD